MYHLTICLLAPLFCWSVGQAQPLTPTEFDLFRNHALRQSESLEDYIQTIADKNRSFEERDDAIRQALKLFVKGATVEVSRTERNHASSSSGTLSTTIPIEKYLQRLKLLGYTKAKQTFGLMRLSDWQSLNDSVYVAKGYFQDQRKIWNQVNNRLTPTAGYGTQRIIEVILCKQNDPFYKEERWMVLFGNSTIQLQTRIHP